MCLILKIHQAIYLHSVYCSVVELHLVINFIGHWTTFQDQNTMAVITLWQLQAHPYEIWGGEPQLKILHCNREYLQARIYTKTKKPLSWAEILRTHSPGLSVKRMKPEAWTLLWWLQGGFLVMWWLPNLWKSLGIDTFHFLKHSVPTFKSMPMVPSSSGATVNLF